MTMLFSLLNLISFSLIFYLPIYYKLKYNLNNNNNNNNNTHTFLLLSLDGLNILLLFYFSAFHILPLN